MNTKWMIVIGLWGCVTVSQAKVASASANAPAADKSKPNFIVILCDDMGVTDVGAFRELYLGASDKQLAHKYTPQLDKLAREGIRCSRAYAASWCAPSRQMLLSGQWVNRRNAYDHPWIGNQLRQEGYVTGWVGKNHGAKSVKKTFRNTDPKTAEFDDGFFYNGGCRRSYLEEGETFPCLRGLVPFDFVAKGGEYLTDVYNDFAVDFINRHADKPFMLYVPHNAPHGPLDGKPEDLRELFPETFAKASDEEIINGRLTSRRGKMSDEQAKLGAMHFAAMVHRVDLGIGRMVETLHKKGILDNTIIIFASDNGRAVGYGSWLTDNHPFIGHKTDVLEGGIRVPFFLWSAALAASKQSGTIYDGLVSLSDIAPTLMGEATDEPNAYPTDGVNLMPYLSGREAPLTGRKWFCSLNRRLEKSTRPYVTGLDAFSDSALNDELVNFAYVEDDQKLEGWIIPQNKLPAGVSYADLPCVVGLSDPATPLLEQTPITGIVPIEGKGRILYDNLKKFLLLQGEELSTQWSGSGDEIEGLSWPMFSGESSK